MSKYRLIAKDADGNTMAEVAILRFRRVQYSDLDGNSREGGFVRFWTARPVGAMNGTATQLLVVNKETGKLVYTAGDVSYSAREHWAMSIAVCVPQVLMPEYTDASPSEHS